MATPPRQAQSELCFESLAEITAGATTRIELCRVTKGQRQGELVAVKRLHPNIAEDPAFYDMFRDEVWMAAALKHQHVVEVVGWGVDATGPYLAVELVKGVSLARLMKTVLETGEIFTERMVVYLASCICDGLAAAHDLRSANGELLGLVHRDLTPGNVLLGFGGEVKITDFGLAKAKQRLTKTLTGLLKGTPEYMSPEQIAGEPLDARADVFALGVLLFELFSGRRPWSPTTDQEAIRATVEQPPADLQSLRPKIDKALAAIVHRCLEKDRARRFQSAGELRDRFQQWLGAHGYREGNVQSLARFVRRNAMRQMRWFERVIGGEPPVPPGSPAGPEEGPTDEGSTQEEGKREPPTLTPDTMAGPASAAVASARPAARAPVPVADEEEGSDWGEEGPTLIQRAHEHQRRLRTAPTKVAAEPARPAAARGQLPTATDPTTMRRGEAPGVLPVPPALPGVLAPPDPDVPSLPLPTVPLPLPARPPPPPSAVPPPSRRVDAPPHAEEAAVTAALPTVPLGAAGAAEISEQAHRLADRAARLAAEAAAAAEAARQAALAADTAAAAASLAAEAVMLAAAGDHAGALRRLHEARTNPASYQATPRQVSGDTAEGALGLTKPRPVAGALAALLQQLLRDPRSAEGLALFTLVAVGLILALLAAVAVRAC
ncbi:MAG: serine/threonine protein kinase [Deltaproteobacteria bacterium]|nr:serine/threonine protein kinase [Deltaproteobacteria bacterium]